MQKIGKMQGRNDEKYLVIISLIPVDLWLWILLKKILHSGNVPCLVSVVLLKKIILSMSYLLGTYYYEVGYEPNASSGDLAFGDKRSLSVG